MPAPRPLDLDAPLSLAYLTYRGKPHVGGQGIYTRHLTKALVDLGHSVEVFGGQPYPVLDERVRLTKLPSLDLFNDHYPGRFPAFWEFKTRHDFLEVAQFSTGVFPEPLAFSARVNGHLSKRLGEFDLVHDNQCLGYGIAKLEQKIPPVPVVITLPVLTVRFEPHGRKYPAEPQRHDLVSGAWCGRGYPDQRRLLARVQSHVHKTD